MVVGGGQAVCLFLAFLLSFFRCGPSERSLHGACFLLMLGLLPLGLYSNAPLTVPFVDLEIWSLGYTIFYDKYGFTIVNLSDSPTTSIYPYFPCAPPESLRSPESGALQALIY